MSALIDIPFPEDCNHCLICSLISELPRRELRERGIQYRLYCKATGECVSGVGRGEDCPLHECKISDVPSAQPEIIRCKDCKHFEYDHLYVIQGIPVLGNEVCNKWGYGCKTNENGYCFLAERKIDEGD